MVTLNQIAIGDLMVIPAIHCTQTKMKRKIIGVAAPTVRIVLVGERVALATFAAEV